MAKTAIILTVLLGCMMLPYGETMPLAHPGLAVAGTVMNWSGGLSGIRDFITGIRTAFGRASDFAHSNGFDYGNVYNSILQYGIVQAFNSGQTNKYMAHVVEETQKMTSEGNKIFFGIMGIIALLCANMVLILSLSGKAQRQDVNVLSNNSR